jgi:hypothetical protein
VTRDDRRPILAAADLHQRIRETAFALLLTGRRAVSPGEIAAAAGVAPGAIGGLLDELGSVGWIDRDPAGSVTGSGGLSLTDGPHRLTIGGAEFRNWCAYDSLGIAAALDADAAIDTTCPICGAPIHLRTIAGEPPAGRPERLWLADGGADLRADFCSPTVLLCSPEHADAWAERQGGRGRAVDVGEGARIGREAWAGCAIAVARVGNASP